MNQTTKDRCGSEQDRW